MLILGLDSSAKRASAAIYDRNAANVIAFGSISSENVKHSETLLPLTESLLQSAKLEISDIDLFAATNGPGSFTGIRIAVSAIKGLAFAAGKPVAGVSTLLCGAYNFADEMFNGKIICSVTDLRRKQFCGAFFVIINSIPKRISPDEIMRVENFFAITGKYGITDEKEIIIAGNDVEQFCRETGNRKLIPAPFNLQEQNAALLCKIASVSGQFLHAKDLNPVYLQKSQAERERENKLL